MSTPIESVREFLSQKRIAVAGVSRDPRQTANFVFRKLRDSGHDVVPVNPSTPEVEGVPCYRDLDSIPGSVDGVMIVTRPEVALALVTTCARLGIRRVWMHRSFGAGSVSGAAVTYGREHGITVIDGGCPAMYCGPVDFSHRCMRWMLAARGKVPR